MADEVDIAIIGAGVSGVYSAWKLATRGKSDSIAVYDSEERVGGRLLSVSPPNIDNMVAELGGMRILPAVQPRITQLIEALNASAGPNDNITTYDFPVDQPDNISYLRGVHLRLDDFTQEPEAVPYNLTFQEFGKTSSKLIVDAINQIVPGITNPSLNSEERRTICQAAEFAGEPLYKQGFWGVLMRVMSGEAYQFAIATGGYQTTLSNWNAADAIPWFLADFGVTPEYKGFEKGFQQVPLTLADRARTADVDIQLGHCVNGITRDAGKFQVTFSNGRQVSANSLILAMPRRALDLLAQNFAVLRDDECAQRLIASVTPRPLFKLFTTYNDPWWLSAGVTSGRSTTDLPVRQTYYWPLHDGRPAKSGRAMLMASYDDGLNVGFWDGFRRKRGQNWRGAKSTAPAPEIYEPREQCPEDPVWKAHRAPKAMVKEVQRQLAVLHGMEYVPEAQHAAFRDWGDDPFGGGWNSWNIGEKSSDVKIDILNPIKGLPVYICGEAYSDDQGWVEGALQTADLMLERHFGLLPGCHS